MIKQLLRRWLEIPDAPPPAAPRKAMQISDAALSDPAIGVPRRQLQAPKLPPGVVPKGKTMALDDGAGGAPALFEWANGMQPGYGCGLFFPGYPYLAELAQRPEYRSPIETIAEEMTRKWIKFVSVGKVAGDADDKIQKLTAAFKEFGIQDLFRRATELDGYFGRGHIFIDIDKQDRDRDKPLLVTKETIRRGSVKGFKVIEPMWCTPIVWNASDPTAPDFYKPTRWYVLGRDTHASRLIPFVSREVPDLLKPSYNFGGISLSQMLENYVQQWLRTKNDVSALIHNYSIIILSTDMESVLSGDGGSDLKKRMEMFIKHRENRGLMAINKESEDLVQIAVPLASLDKLQAQAQEHMCAVSRIPLVKAFGITPTGLNASEEGEIMVFYDHIAARQEIGYTKNLRLVNHILQLHLFGEIDETIEAEFVELKELDGEALGRVRKGDAELASTLIQSGVISPAEERARLVADPNSGYNALVVEDVPDPADIPTNFGVGEEENEDESAEA